MMMRKDSIRVLCAGLLWVGVAAYAQDFSADIVNQKSERGASEAKKLFVSGDKVRFESLGAQGRAGGVMIWNAAENKHYFLVPEKQVYMELGSRTTQQAVAFWRPADIENACPEWQKLAEQMKTRDKYGSCSKVGHDMVNGRDTVKYQGTSTDGKTVEIWLDSKLRSLIKIADADGGMMELRNIQEGSQPGSLFEIPPGYQKMDMGMNRPLPTPH